VNNSIQSKGEDLSTIMKGELAPRALLIASPAGVALVDTILAPKGTSVRQLRKSNFALNNGRV
jgi:hypothetical protein